MFDSSLNIKDSIVFIVDDITVEVHPPQIEETGEENKKRLAKYLYRLIEMNDKVA